MSANTPIEWTRLPGFGEGASWNPVRGCRKVSPGCDNCYAEAFAERWRGISGHPYGQGFDLRLVLELLDRPLRWRRPRGIFVNSMSDLFQAGVPNEFVAATFGVMASASRHVFMVLTKRPGRAIAFFEWLDGVAAARRQPWETIECAKHMALLSAASRARVDLYRGDADRGDGAWPLPPVWIGVSVDDRRHGLPRIRHLRRVPAAVRFLSVEPLLEDLGDLDLSGVDWVIVGGESGPAARPFDLAWARRIVAQAREQRVPVFVKQVGDRPVEGGELVQIRVRKGGGDARPADLRINEFPNVLQRRAA